MSGIDDGGAVWGANDVDVMGKAALMMFGSHPIAGVIIASAADAAGCSPAEIKVRIQKWLDTSGAACRTRGELIVSAIHFASAMLAQRTKEATQ